MEIRQKVALPQSKHLNRSVIIEMRRKNEGSIQSNTSVQLFLTQRLEVLEFLLQNLWCLPWSLVCTSSHQQDIVQPSTSRQSPNLPCNAPVAQDSCFSSWHAEPSMIAEEVLKMEKPNEKHHSGWQTDQKFSRLTSGLKLCKACDWNHHLASKYLSATFERRRFESSKPGRSTRMASCGRFGKFPFTSTREVRTDCTTSSDLAMWTRSLSQA